MSGCDLRECRESAGLTQADLSELLGVSRIWLALQERGGEPLERRTELAVRYVFEVLLPDAAEADPIAALRSHLNSG